MRDYKDYLADMQDSVNGILKFTHKLTFKTFCADKKTVNAVVRSLEIIGEAARNIPAEVRNKYSDVPWKKMVGMRNKLIHEYFGVDLEIIWNLIEDEIPGLAVRFREIAKKENIE